MKLAAIHGSKVSALVEIAELVPTGKVFVPDLMTAIAERCEFRKFPQDFGKKKEEAGAVFEIGKWNDQPINKLTIFNDGVVIETNSDTSDTDTTLEQLLMWAKKEIGITYESEMIRRKHFTSQLVIYSDMQLDALHPILRELAAFVSSDASKQADHQHVYRTAGITLSTNTLESKFAPTAFSIERRIDVPDSNKKYFSTAPLRTKDHLALLEKFEKALQHK
jgi:hypothetical protein